MKLTQTSGPLRRVCALAAAGARAREAERLPRPREARRERRAESQAGARSRLFRGAAAAFGLALALLAAPVSAGEAEDEALRNQIQEQMSRAEFVEPFEVTVRAEDGKVSLHGRVGSAHERLRAEEIARTVDGVDAVDNQLLVIPTEH